MANESAAQPAPSKRDAIIEAATRVFLDNGYGASSMDGIADVAEVSKQTIYSHFEGKEALFGAIVREKCDQLLETVSRPASRGADPKAALTGVGRRFLNLVLPEEGMALFRAVVAESGRFPELAEAFYSSGPRLAVANLAAYLGNMHENGTLTVDEPVRSARLFFSMLRGDLYMRRLLALDPAPPAEEVNRTVDEAVSVFLGAHAPN